MSATYEARTVLFTQIAAVGVANNQATQCNWVLFGLDRTGRIWQLTDQHPWQRVENPALLVDDTNAAPYGHSMLPNASHPGPGCSCRECLRAHP